MSCQEWEQQIALAVGDDLSAEERAQVEQHISTCSECRTAYAEMAAIRAELLSLEDVDEAAVADLRQSVLSRLTHRHPWRRVAAVAAAAVFAVVGLTLRWPEVPGPPAMPPMIRAAVPEVVPVLRAGVQPVVHRARRAPKRALETTPEPAREPVLVKLITDDPDIVIIWIAD